MKKEPLYEKIYNDLLSMIRSGQLQEGDRLPSEKEIAARYKVSHITSQRALSLLSENGHIVRRAGLGSFVGQGAGAVPASRRRPFIGLVVPDAGDLFGMATIRSLIPEAGSLGYDVVMQFNLNDQSKEKENIELLKGLGAQGIIILPVFASEYNIELLRAVIDNYPIVTINRTLHGIPTPSVSSDNVGGTAALTRHLIEKGHRRIGYISNNIETSSGLQERYQGFRLAIDATKDVEGVVLISQSAYNHQDKGHLRDEEIIDYFKTNPDVTGIVCHTSLLAEHVEQVAAGLGKRVPDDLSLVCFDTAVQSRLTPYTHVAQPEQAIAREAVRLLHGLVCGNETEEKHITLPCRFEDHASVRTLTL